MTTSHRAQLEARSGAKAASYIPTGTEHARLLPGHTKLKFRKDKQNHQLVSDAANITSGNTKPATADEKHSDVHQETLEDEDSDDDQSSDEEQNALLQELNKIRQERMVAKIKKEQDLQDKGERESLSNVLPMRQTRGDWRSSTTFGRNKVSKATAKTNDSFEKTKIEYSNDLAESGYHRDFLRRFVR